LVLRLLGSRTFDALLEVGYGSGVFLPELSKMCHQLFGIDTHRLVREVAAALEKVGVVATLKSGSVTALPFADGSFDGVVAVSTLEFVEDLATACRELSRVPAERSCRGRDAWPFGASIWACTCSPVSLRRRTSLIEEGGSSQP
jgi:ubiquinone/menaquinone biosynthesis C-methylase UbiE